MNRSESQNPKPESKQLKQNLQQNLRLVASVYKSRENHCKSESAETKRAPPIRVTLSFSARSHYNTRRHHTRRLANARRAINARCPCDRLPGGLHKRPGGGLHKSLYGGLQTLTWGTTQTTGGTTEIHTTMRPKVCKDYGLPGGLYDWKLFRFSGDLKRNLRSTEGCINSQYPLKRAEKPHNRILTH